MIQRVSTQMFGQASLLVRSCWVNCYSTLFFILAVPLTWVAVAIKYDWLIVPGQEFWHNHLLDFAWVPLSAFVALRVLGLTRRSWYRLHSKSPPSRLSAEYSVGVVVLATVAQLFMEYKQLTGGLVRYQAVSAGVGDEIINFIALHQGAQFDWADVAMLALAGIITMICVVKAPRGE